MASQEDTDEELAVVGEFRQELNIKRINAVILNEVKKQTGEFPKRNVNRKIAKLVKGLQPTARKRKEIDYRECDSDGSDESDDGSYILIEDEGKEQKEGVKNTEITTNTDMKRKSKKIKERYILARANSGKEESEGEETIDRIRDEIEKATLQLEQRKQRTEKRRGIMAERKQRKLAEEEKERNTMSEERAKETIKADSTTEVKGETISKHTMKPVIIKIKRIQEREMNVMQNESEEPVKKKTRQEEAEDEEQKKDGNTVFDLYRKKYLEHKRLKDLIRKKEEDHERRRKEIIEEEEARRRKEECLKEIQKTTTKQILEGIIRGALQRNIGLLPIPKGPETNTDNKQEKNEVARGPLNSIEEKEGTGTEPNQTQERTEEGMIMNTDLEAEMNVELDGNMNTDLEKEENNETEENINTNLEKGITMERNNDHVQVADPLQEPGGQAIDQAQIITNEERGTVREEEEGSQLQNSQNTCTRSGLQAREETPPEAGTSRGEKDSRTPVPEIIDGEGSSRDSRRRVIFRTPHRRTLPLETKEGIFGEFKNMDRKNKVFLKHLNFLLFQNICTQVKRHHSSLWKCIKCGDENELMAKKAAIIHARRNHGHMVDKNENNIKQTKTILEMGEKHKKLGYQMVYPCFKTSCQAFFVHPLEVFFHLRTSHHNSVEEFLCFSCQHPLGDNNIEKHWSTEHVALRCREPDCNNLSLSQLNLYLAHMNIHHASFITDNVSYHTLLRLYRRIQENTYSIDGMPSIRAMVFSDYRNGNFHYTPYSKPFRRLCETLREGELPFSSLVIEHLDDNMYEERHNQPLPRIMRKLHMEMKAHTIAKEAYQNEPLSTELYWQRPDLQSPPFFCPTAYCAKCKDSEYHLNPENCIEREMTDSYAGNVHQNAEFDKMTIYAGLLIGVKKEIWGQTPHMKNLCLYNASDVRETVTYATGHLGKVPVNFKKREVTILSFTDYFGHCRLMLEALRGKVVEPVLMEFFEAHETNCPEEMYSMVRGYVEAFMQIQKEYRYTMMILCPVPKMDKEKDMTGYLNSLHRTRQFTKMLMVFATTFNLGVVPTEGYLYSVPLNSKYTLWQTYLGEGKEKPLRNRDGSLTTTYLKRAGNLLEVVIEQFRLARRDYARSNPHLGMHTEVSLENSG